MTQKNANIPDSVDSRSAAARTLAERMIDHVEVQVEAFVGSAQMTVAELAALKHASTIVLDAPLSQSVELRLNGAVIARGELVAVGDNFGVRLTEIAE